MEISWRKDNQEGRHLFVDRHLEKEPRAALLRKYQTAQELPTHAYAFVMLEYEFTLEVMRKSGASHPGQGII